MPESNYTVDDQSKKLAQLQQQCDNDSSTHPGWCPTIWDGILCWTSTAPGELATQPCPGYIAGFDRIDKNATRLCNSTGQWYFHPGFNTTWTNYSDCHSSETATIIQGSNTKDDHIPPAFRHFLPMIKYTSQVGYSMSLFTLIVAFCILISVKRLRCQRNILHLHLFASFIARATMSFLKDILFESGVDNLTEMANDGKTYLRDLDLNWSCKATTVIWQYCLFANYSWILMEGLYLYNLVFSSMFIDGQARFYLYVLMGWGIPVIVVGNWAVFRIVFEDTYCWTTHDNTYIFQFILIPILISVFINFYLFVKILIMLSSKLKSTVNEDVMRYKRLAKSTLVLVPLFGVHYTIFCGMWFSMGGYPTIEIIWLFCDQFFASFQGFFIAILYCFVNSEVRMELNRVLHARLDKWPKPIPKCYCKRCWIKKATRETKSCTCNGNNVRKKGRLQNCWHNWLELWNAITNNQTSTHSLASTQDIDLGIATRGVSLASSRDCLQVTDTVDEGIIHNTQESTIISFNNSTTSGKQMNENLLSFVSKMSKADGCSIPKFTDKVEINNCNCVCECEDDDDAVKSNEDHYFRKKENFRNYNFQDDDEDDDDDRIREEHCFTTKKDRTCECLCECNVNENDSLKKKSCTCDHLNHKNHQNYELHPLCHLQGGP